jgi:hypothetical protein
LVEDETFAATPGKCYGQVSGSVSGEEKEELV